MPFPQRPSDFDIPFLLGDAGDYVESPSELQPSLTTDWMHVTSYDDLLPSTPCLQDLMQDEFDIGLYGGDRLVEASSQQLPYKNLLQEEYPSSDKGSEGSLVQLHGMSSSPSGPGVAQARRQRAAPGASMMCPSPSSPFPPDLSEVTMPPIPVMVEEGPNSLFFTQDLGSPMPGEASPSSRSTTPDTLMDFPVYGHADFECILSVNHMHTPEGSSVKSILKNAIRKKRKSQGLDEECPDTKEARTNEMTEADTIRYERRKASNRKAATKLRQKKKVEASTLHKEIKTLEEENDQLRAEAQSSKDEITRLQKVISDHKRGCGWDPDHQWA